MCVNLQKLFGFLREALALALALAVAVAVRPEASEPIARARLATFGECNCLGCCTNLYSHVFLLGLTWRRRIRI